MIGKAWAIQAAMLVLTAGMLIGCASSVQRMPPAGPVGMAPMTAPAPAPVAPAPVYDLPAATPPYATPPYAAQTPYAATSAYPTPYTEPVPAAPAPVSGIAGLTERQPDLCKASEQASRIGQSGSVIPTLGLTRTYRIVAFRGIEPQDYDPNRLVFRLDAAGIITKIDCG